MHSRLKELMPKPWTFPYPDRELYTKEQFEKFAELVVRECALVADMGWAAPGTQIKQHFGVEQ